MDSSQFADRVVVVTGGTSGIGLAVAERFAAVGARVVVIGRDRGRLCAAADTLAGSAGGVLPLTCDVSSSESVDQAFRTVVEELGEVDVLVNNAGGRTRAPFWELTDGEWDAVVGAILRGTFLCSRAVVSSWLKSGRRGVIVNVGSIGAHQATPTQAHYAAAKGGVGMLTKTMAVELAPHGIRVNTVDPGAIKTPMIADRLNNAADLEFYAQHIPMGAVGMPADVAAAVTFLASDEAAYITGASLAVDGGWLAK